MELSHVRAVWPVVRLTALCGLGIVAVVSLLLTATSLLGPSNLWMRLQPAGDLPPPVDALDQVELHLLCVSLSRGGLAIWRAVINGFGISGISLRHPDKSTTVLRADSGFAHHADSSASYPRLVAGPANNLYGFSWMGLTVAANEGFSLVLPLPVLAVTAGAWPAVVAWRWWRRRRRGNSPAVSR